MCISRRPRGPHRSPEGATPGRSPPSTRFLADIEQASVVPVTALTDRDYIRELPSIVDGIENAVIPDADPPEVGGCLRFSPSLGARCSSEGFYSSEDPQAERPVSRSSSLRSERAKTTAYSSMNSASISGRESMLHTFKRFPGLAVAFSRQGTVRDVFPQFGVQLEIDDDVGLLAGIVDDETHTLH